MRFCLTGSAPARGAISSTMVKFSSSLDSVDRRTIYRVFDPDQPAYVGSGPDVDKNWEELTIRSCILLY